MVKKLFIANRGEIALRIAKTCREMGICTVGAYTPVEEGLPHTYQLDETFCLGDGPLKETYLNHEKIISLAKDNHCDAIHPGYGFLSENAEFRKKVEAAQLIFIGPSAHAMELMGDKMESKRSMEKLGVPVIPGYHGDNVEYEFLRKKAQEIGTPLLIKASAGGGGKGMRVVDDLKDFEEALNSAKREALNAFGDERVLLEKFIESPRHIEIQVLCDRHGNNLSLLERECSIQRRHQKVIEECPSSVLTDKLRAEMGAVAVKICEHIQYEGAGTIEFIVDEKLNFYFLEMNTRLQVEHPVTEMVTGLDLVSWQIKIARGEKLPFKQSDIVPHGHAVEMRIYAEDPQNGFLPTTGLLSAVRAPDIPFTRFDCGYETGNKVSVDFDPMLAKMVAWGETREEAINKAYECLKTAGVFGVVNNQSFMQKVLDHPAFREGKIDTHFIEKYKDDLLRKNDEDIPYALAAYLVAQVSSNASQERISSWETLTNFRNC